MGWGGGGIPVVGIDGQVAQVGVQMYVLHSTASRYLFNLIGNGVGPVQFLFNVVERQTCKRNWNKISKVVK